jgi:hypothetical protein
VGFEPTNGGFADLSLGPLGYRAESLKYSKSSKTTRTTRRTGASIILYFFSVGAGMEILASRKNRADSSGGVGLM